MSSLTHEPTGEWAVQSNRGPVGEGQSRGRAGPGRQTCPTRCWGSARPSASLPGPSQVGPEAGQAPVQPSAWGPHSSGTPAPTPARGRRPSPARVPPAEGARVRACDSPAGSHARSDQDTHAMAGLARTAPRPHSGLGFGEHLQAQAPPRGYPPTTPGRPPSPPAGAPACQHSGRRWGPSSLA